MQIAPKTTPKIVTALLFGMLCAGAAFAKDSSTKFLKKAAESGIAEVRMSELALQKTGNPKVKEFAEMMVRDHKSANARIEELSRQKKVSLPMEPSAADKAKAKRLEGMEPAGFDVAYMRENVNAHEKVVKAFSDQAKDGTDKDVKAFAAETLPKLEHHLKMARELHAQVDAKGHAAEHGDHDHKEGDGHKH